MNKTLFLICNVNKFNIYYICQVVIIFSMEQIPFSVSARTAKLIGQENFANADGAIIELVKNSYDADSNVCVVVFDKKESSIIIIDNGTGMTDEDIINHWMIIGTNDKEENFQSLNGRVKTGAKGIGRFAMNRLGLVSELRTISREKKKGYYWRVNWSDFDLKGANISQVKADFDLLNEFSLNTYLSSRFSELDGLMNVFERYNFDYGTIIEITQLNDNWDYKSIKKLFDNLEILIPPIEQPVFEINVFSTNGSEGLGKVNSAYFDDYDYKVCSHYFGDSDRKLTIEITRKELNYSLLKTKYLELFELPFSAKYPYRIDDFNDEPFIIETSINNLKGFSENVDNKLMDKIGEFYFTFYFIKNSISDNKSEGDIKKYPYRSFQPASRKAWLKKFGGVKLFRDNFRVRPYGENGEDWLKLGERQSQSPGGAGQKMGGYKIRPNQISGTISISRIDNKYFEDKSSREGIQENEVFDLFKNLLLEIIGVFEKDRNTIMYNLSSTSLNRNSIEEKKRKAKEISSLINEGSKINQQVENEEKSNEEILAEGYTTLEQELDEKEEEVRILRNLASSGLIISSFAHEIKGLRSRLIPRTDSLITELRKLIPNSLLNGINRYENPFILIETIKEEDIKLKHWLDYSLSSLKKDKRKRININITDYFSRFKLSWIKAVEQRNISIKLNNLSQDDIIIKAFEIDLDSIFNNLLSNSLASLKESDKKQKTIIIDWEKKDDYVEIVFFDNGKGLSKEYIENPEEIFNSFETSKRDRIGNIIGTGLGLYIVKQIVDEYSNASIKIGDINDSFSLIISFKCV